MENGYQVDSIYADLSKAFDMVNHNLLLRKLNSYGVDGLLLKWIGSYLANRKQMVRINHFYSCDFPVLSGVPQGSHLGPLLFNLFVNDITLCFSHSNILLFADDLKLFKIINDNTTVIELQSDVDGLVNWCEINGMMLNIQKCFIMRFHRTHNPITFDYTMNRRPLDTVHKIRDLGVILDTSLSFKHHISNITCKSMKMLGFLKRVTCDFTDTTVLKILYCTLVRTHLDYCSSVWSPHYVTYIANIDRVQNNFLRYVAFKTHINGNYTMLERFLNIPSLTTRRNHRDLTLLFNILNGKYNCPDLLSRISLFIPPRHTRQHDLFYIPFYRLNVCFYSCLPRTLRLANTYVNLNLFVSSVEQFKRQLSSLDM